MFGVGSVPIASYFGLPQGASADTRFSPQARGMLAQGEEYAREQAAMDAERAAEELLGGAADMTDEEIQGQLTQNPRMFGTQAIQPLSGYMQFRQSTTPQTDVTLGPILREKIQDPYHREQFEKRMLEGASANDAFDAYRTDEYNMKFETALAEAGVPETEYAKLKTPSGKFIPAAVARAKQAAETKAAEANSALTRRTSDDPLDKKIDAYAQAMKRREDIFKATGREAELAKDQTYLGYIAKIEEAEKAKFAVVDPALKPVIGPSAKIPVAPEAVSAQSFRTPEERQKAVQEAEKAAPIKQAIDATWTQEKAKLAEQIRKVYGDNPEDIVLAARAVLNNEADPEASRVEFEGGQSNYAKYLLRKAGRKAEDVVFEEPGDSRKILGIGSQKVKNAELLQAWAEDVLALVAQLEQAQTGQQAPASGKFSVGAPVKVGGP
jgi:hypothetical protein